MAALLGVGLAASCGLRAFLPLLLLSAAAKWHLFNVHLGPQFAWLESDTALIALALATIIEMAGDKIPAVDHALDAIGTALRPLAGAFVAAAAVSGQNWTADPTTAAIIGLAAGAPVAFGLHAAKAGTRGASTATTFGFANPLISFLEDVLVVVVCLLALLTPLLVPLVLVAAFAALWKAFKLIRRPGRAATA